jgi:hypothetical protein
MNGNSQYWPKPPKKVFEIFEPVVESVDGKINFYIRENNVNIASCQLTKLSDNLFELGGGICFS